jgi:fibronectin-binding autotransporter adhesin
MLEERATPTVTLTGIANLPFNPSADGLQVVDGPVVDAAGNLYDVAVNFGGGDVQGTVFKVTPGSNTPITLATFSASSNGGFPNSHLVIDSKGDLFGTTSNGGATLGGTVFEVPAGGGGISTVATFAQDPNGVQPALNGITPNGLLLVNGTLYGTTFSGGANGDGTVFSVPAAPNSSITLIGTFDYSNGYQPNGGLALSGGVLYGTTQFGGDTGNGAVFSVPAVANSTIKEIGAVSGLGAGSPTANGYVVVNGTTVYGTDIQDGASSTNGSVFEVSTTANAAVPSMFPFNGTNASPNNGSLPNTLINDAGTLVGTTNQGGTKGEGAVFAFQPNGLALGLAIPSPISFSDTNSATSGGSPYGSLALDSSGNVYGVSKAHGGQSTIFWELSGLVGPPFAFAQSPSSGTVGKALSTVLVAYNNAPAGSTVTLSLSDPNGGLKGTLTQPVVNGVATFPGLTIAKAGKFTLNAVSGSLSAVSNLINVIPPLTVTSVYTWTGLGNAHWSDGADWMDNDAPVVGEPAILVFPKGAANTTNFDDIGGLQVSSLQVYGSYILAGALPLGVSSSLAVNAPASRVTVGLPIALTGNVTVALVGGEMDLVGKVSGAGNMIVAGSGLLGLFAANTYTGNTTIQAGTVEITSNTAVGSGVLVINGGEIITNSPTVALANPIVIGGSFTLTGVTGGSLAFTNSVQTVSPAAFVVALNSGFTLVSTKYLSVVAGGTLAIQGGTVGLFGSVAGHVQLTTVSPHNASATVSAATLLAGSEVEILAGSVFTVSGPMSGTGTLAANDGVLNNLINQSNLASFGGAVELGGNAKILTNGPLGTGQLNLGGGGTIVSNSSLLVLNNAMTIFAGNFTIQQAAGATVVFNGPIEVLLPTQVTLNAGFVTRFVRDIGFNLSNNRTLIFTGQGTVNVTTKDIKLVTGQGGVTIN